MSCFLTPRRWLALALLGASFAAAAAVELAPGTTIQPARRGATFPSPIRLLVTDDASRPVGAGHQVVLWAFLSTFALPFDAGRYYAYATTDASGIATLPNLSGSAVGTTTFTVDAQEYGEMTLRLEVTDAPPPAQVRALAGPTAPLVAGTTAAEPFRVQVIDTTGQPVPFATVEFDALSSDTARASFDGEVGAAAVADASGIATSPLLTAAMVNPTYAATMYPAQGHVRAIASGPVVSMPFTVAKPAVVARAQDLWWGGLSETGWGVSVFEHRDIGGPILFVVLFVYDDSGKPIWYVMPSGGWRSGYGTHWSGPVYKPSGSPFHSYDAASHRVGASVGQATLKFIGSSAMKLEYQAFNTFRDSGRGEKRLHRLDFSNDTPSPLTQVDDLWWGGVSQNGWGLAIHEQKGALFSLWFTYGEDRAPTWFVMPNGSWIDSTTYAGDIFTPSGARWLGVAYDASRHRVTNVGSFVLRFPNETPARRATFEYYVAPHAGSIDLSRVPFGADESPRPAGP